MRQEIGSVLIAAGISPLSVFLASVPLVFLSLTISPSADTVAGRVIEAGWLILVLGTFGSVVAYLCMLVIGLPLALLALRLNRTSWPFAVLVGAATGFATAVFAAGSFELRGGALMAWFGVAVSGSFYLLFNKIQRAQRATTAV
jgi:hypothetical protein